LTGMPGRTPSSLTVCRRCGTCCAKGGPALHFGDFSLLQSGVLTRSDLCTFRAGEPMHDQVRGAVRLLQKECVKIRSVAGGSACIFHEQGKAACGLYAHRPLECRAMKCWDAAELEKALQQPRMIRRDLIKADCALDELIREHEARCGCARLLEWLDLGTAEALMALQEASSYDTALRAVLVEREVLDPGELAFLLGRPLDVVIQGLLRWQKLRLKGY
jgi:Fe-S-cluster containining protein